MDEIQDYRRDVPPRIFVWLAALSASSSFLFLIFWIDVTILPDYDNYLLWATEFQEKSWVELGFAEFFSFAQIKFFGSLGNNVETGLRKLYIFNGIIASFGLFGLSVRYGKTVSGVLLVYILYGPLLTYITLRATPAYIFASWFILLRNGIFIKLILMTIASLYHVTSIIPAFLVVGASFLKSNIKSNFEGNKIKVNLSIIAILILGTLIQIIWSLGIGDSVSRHVAGLIFANEKIQEYLETASLYRSKAHLGYFVFVLATACFYLYTTSDSINFFWWFVVSASIVFIFLSISPVAAYRFSIFLLLPIFLNFPETKNMAELFVKYFIICIGMVIGIVQIINLFNN